MVALAGVTWRAEGDGTARVAIAHPQLHAACVDILFFFFVFVLVVPWSASQDQKWYLFIDD